MLFYALIFYFLFFDSTDVIINLINLSKNKLYNRTEQ